ncbi:hypothetical protein AACH06_18795 [Ideonella sp. DXS29W]|uniref:DUF3592 domain-containing protein n=1 Tax=Ideonella lacteola TaxID=2984193 RepID=A0ABU9BSC5_9BURK
MWSMKACSRWVVSLLTAAPVLLILGVVVWQEWRDHKLLAFCREVRPGMRVSVLIDLERHHRIDGSYIVQATFVEELDQSSIYDLEFRSQFLDPDFACAINHDGETVKSVQLLTLEGYIPD